jgi:hypothetical protein
MGPGHFGVGLLIKPFAPKAPLWALMVAAEALDIFCFGFSSLGLERFGGYRFSLPQGISVVDRSSIPWSHGLFMSAVWSVLAAGIAYSFTRDRRAAWAIGLVVFSHWVLDFIVHLPDLPLLFDGSPLVGLGLWGSGPGFITSIILEFGLLIAGLVVIICWRIRK